MQSEMVIFFLSCIFPCFIYIWLQLSFFVEGESPVFTNRLDWHTAGAPLGSSVVLQGTIQSDNIFVSF